MQLFAQYGGRTSERADHGWRGFGSLNLISTLKVILEMKLTLHDAGQRMKPTKPNRLVQALWDVSRFIMMENVRMRLWN